MSSLLLLLQQTRISTASARSQWALPDLNRERQMSDRMPQRMPDRMSDTSGRMPYRISEDIYMCVCVSERMPDGMSEYISERMLDIMSEYMSDRISVGGDHSKKVILPIDCW